MELCPPVFKFSRYRPAVNRLRSVKGMIEDVLRPIQTERADVALEKNLSLSNIGLDINLAPGTEPSARFVYL